MSEFRMPSLGSDMEAGTLVEQSVSAGDTVRAGDVIGAVETQKGVIEIEIFEDGTFGHWLAEIGQTVPVGAPLAVILHDETETEPHPAAPPVNVSLSVPEEPTTPPDTEPLQPEPKDPEIDPAPPEIPDSPAPPPQITPDEIPIPSPIEPEIPPIKETSPLIRQKITPAARRLAAVRGIDLTTLDADLKEPITRRDIEMIASPKTDRITTDFRSAISAAMERSKREIPHYYLSHDVDLSTAESFISTENAKREPADRLLLGVVYAKAVAAAIAKFPEFNGHYINSRFRPSQAVHLGFAINLRSGGLVAPALFDADRLSLSDLMQNLRDLSTRVREGRFRARELSDATLTLTCLGERGTDAVFGVIYPPQVAIIGTGIARKRATVVDDKLAVRTMATCTLAADHRVSDGHRGALFLRSIDKHLQAPEKL